MQFVDLVLNPFLGIMAVAYAALAVRVARTSPQYATSSVSFFLALIAGMLAGSAFSYNADSAGLYSIGRTLSYSAAGFLPLVFYTIYREYTVGPPRVLYVVILAVIPMLSMGIALTNSMHNILWIVNETPTGIVYSEMTSHPYYSRVY
ncbi:MAG: histidine kinase N-terminal 7TM domain-containing protein, partial [Pseudomonadota bacterium]